MADRVVDGGAASGVSFGSGAIQRACAKCEEEASPVQRDGGSGGAMAAPVSVEGALSSSAGKPLDRDVRAYFEPRFGFDFGSVRIHDDARGHASARDIAARAYTAGSDIVFARGQYTPRTREGTRLLAHELTHVVQQARGAHGVLQRESGPERTHTVTDDETLYSIARRYGVTVQAIKELNGLTSDTIRAPMVLRIPAAAASPEPAQAPPTTPPQETTPQQTTPQQTTPQQTTPPAPAAPATNWAGTVLSSADRSALAQFLFVDVGVTPGNATGSVDGARFLLHDTSGASSRAHIESEALNARGPLGSGPNAFIPATGLEILQRPDFFDPRRPTTTEHEKGTDILDESHRNAALRAVWAVTASAQRSAAITRALAGLPLSAAEVTSETTGATTQLNATTGRVFTTATWAVGEICAEVGRSGVATVAAAGRDADLTAACTAVEALLAARQQRIGSTVSVELVQVGARSGGNQNTCDPSNPDILPLPTPPYSDTQYWNTTLMYLRAAVMAGRYPEVTTHFVVDAFTRGHCDPRCFHLDQLYQTIAGVLAPLGHAGDSLYGVTPSYGTRSGTNTVWWNTSVCHGAAPR